MGIIYRGSSASRLSHSTVDGNFSYLNDNKLSQTDPTGAALIPSAYVTLAAIPTYSHNFFFNTRTNFFGYWGSSGGTRTYVDVLPKGPTGPVGSLIGSVGLTGSAGPTGTTGIDGIAGVQGANGLAGAAGQTGRTGSTGPVGATGNSGASGFVGFVGATGPTGPTGPTGATTSYPTTSIRANVNNNYTSFKYANAVGSSDYVGITSAYGVNVCSAPNLYVGSVDSAVPAMLLNRSINGSSIYLSRSNGTLSNVTLFYMTATMGGSTSGSLTMNGGSAGVNNIVYSSVSDYRTKHNITEITSGELEKINKLSVYSYNKLDENVTEYGVLAHELAEVYPQFVTGKKDACDEKNIPIYQTVDYVGLVPHLTLAIKELINEIEELETQINTLSK